MKVTKFGFLPRQRDVDRVHKVNAVIHLFEQHEKACQYRPRERDPFPFPRLATNPLNADNDNPNNDQQLNFSEWRRYAEEDDVIRDIVRNMDKKESKEKDLLKDQLAKSAKRDEELGTGFPKDLDFKKFLGCGG